MRVRERVGAGPDTGIFMSAVFFIIDAPPSQAARGDWHRFYQMGWKIFLRGPDCPSLILGSASGHLKRFEVAPALYFRFKGRGLAWD
ncbi:MAG: hypothetical protein U5J83_19120 [Bryobacterales bacterium]|nr:hypothetical protein [Bryobacterales bacterium]